MNKRLGPRDGDAAAALRGHVGVPPLFEVFDQFLIG
jgi:hypothetical protein